MRKRQSVEDQPAFTPGLLPSTVSCSPAGSISIDPFGDGNREQWLATLIVGVTHDPALAIWSVTVRDRLEEPVACFLAPAGASPRRLTAQAAAALQAIPQTRQPLSRGDAIVIGACVLSVVGLVVTAAVLLIPGLHHVASDVLPF